MSARLSTACLLLAGLLVVHNAPLAAKPPDLPLQPEILCAPAHQVVPAEECEEAASVPSPVAMPPATPQLPAAQEESDLHVQADWCAGLRTFHRCLLCAAHPLLSLFPVQDACEEEGEVLLQVEETRTGTLACGTCVNTDASLGCNERNFDIRRAAVSLKDLLSGKAFCDVGQEIQSCWHALMPKVHCRNSSPVPGTCTPSSSCAKDCGPNCPAAVLEEAQKIYQLADFCRRTGHPGAACFYYELVHRRYPGSEYDQPALAQIQQLQAQQVASGHRCGQDGCEEQETPEPAHQEDSRFTCPYLKQQQAAGKTAPPAAVIPPSDVLGNLEKLEQAEKIYHEGEQHEHQHRLDRARACYEKVCQLCPGSHYDQLAGEHLRQLQARASAPTTQGGTEEQELVVPGHEHYGPAPKKSGSVQQRLDAPLSVLYHDAPLQEVIADLAHLQGVNIVLDEPALASEGVNIQYPVTIKVRNVPADHVLNLVLQQVHLTYRVQDDVVLVTTENGARGKLVTRVYTVDDLVVGDKPSASANSQTPEDGLVHLITVTVHPESWDVMGGAGTIDYSPLGMSLVVTQTADIQQDIEILLAALRRLKGKPGASKEAPHGCHDRHSSSRGVEGRVDSLLRACQEAFHKGQYAHAEELARKALDIDAERVNAHPLVYKEHLLTQIRDAVRKQPACSKGCGGCCHQAVETDDNPCCRALAEMMEHFDSCYKEGHYEQAEQYALQILAVDPTNPVAVVSAALATLQLKVHPATAEAGSCPMRQPELPAVDPGIVSALEKVLNTVGEPQQGETETEEQELSGKPASGRLDQATSLAPGLVHKLADLLPPGVCVDVEGPVECPRGRCHFQAGHLSVTLSWDCRTGHGSCTLSLPAEESSSSSDR